MAKRKSGQERLASRVSQIANGKVVCVFNQNGTIEVYSPSMQVVWIVYRDQTITARSAKRNFYDRLDLDGERLSHAAAVLVAATLWNERQEPRD